VGPCARWKKRPWRGRTEFGRLAVLRPGQVPRRRLPPPRASMTVAPDAYLTYDAQHLIHSLHHAGAQPQSLVWTRREGALLYDQHDRPVLDALSGLWNVLVGHGRR